MPAVVGRAAAMSSTPQTPLEPPTLVVLLTPPGQSALATLLVEGPRALAVVADVVQTASGRALASFVPDRLAFGRFRLHRDRDVPAEEVVVRPRGGESVEIHCHGGQAVVDMLRRTLVDRGCLPVAWAQWCARKSDDAIAAEAMIALAEAKTERTALILLDQYSGAMRAAMQSIAECARRGDWHAAARQCQVLQGRVRLGSRLVRPWDVALAGPPNAGKSSLINAMVGYRRAIVDPQAGTTRDVVTAATAVQGWPVELADTAGLCDPAHPLERAGVDRARRRLAGADLVVLVFDASAAMSADEALLRAEFPQALVVLNKCDLPEAAGAGRTCAVRTSALSGEGVAELWEAIADRLVGDVPPPGGAAPFTPRQTACLAALAAAIAAPDAAAVQRAVAAMLALPAQPD